MGAINIANSAKRDAVVTTESVQSPKKVRWLDEQGRQNSSVRVVKSTIDVGVDSLEKEHGSLDGVADALIAGDPEIDFESTGRFLKDTSRVYLNGKKEIAHKVHFWEIVKNPDGTERERRRRKLADQNIAGATPLRWSGIFIDKAEACRKYVFSGKVQLHHINGLTFDFLFGMAKELEDRDALMMLGAGVKSNQPLILRRGSVPYRGFLEGQTQDDRYSLVLHFSNMELKAPTEPEEAS